MYDDFEDYEGYEFEDYEADYLEYEELELEAADCEEMEALMEAAIYAESEAEEDAFLGAIASIASKVLPKAISIGRKVLPKLVSAGKRFISQARRSPYARRAAKAGVNVVARTAQDVLRSYSQGRPVSPHYIARRAAGHAAHTAPYVAYGRNRYPSWSRQARRRPSRSSRRYAY